MTMTRNHLVVVVLLALTGATTASVVIRGRGFSPPPSADPDFKMTWAIPDTNTVTVPGYNGANYNCTIDWGDGSPVADVTAWNDADLSHSYAAADSYQITIAGTFERIYFADAGDKALITSVDNFGSVGWTWLANAFYGCANLTSIGGDHDFSAITAISDSFRSCSSLPSLPSGLFAEVTIPNTAIRAFQASSSLTTLPAGLFDSCTNTTSFQATFQQCPIQSVPSGFFDNNSLVISFFSTFAYGDLASIPSGLFDNNPLVTTFAYTFYLNNFTSIPAGLFDNNPLVTVFDSTFSACSSLTTAPAGLFDACTNVVSYAQTFKNCASLTNMVLLTIPASCTTAEDMYSGCASLTADASTITNNSAQLSKWGCPDSLMTYQSTNGFLSANVMHGLNLEFQGCNLVSNQVSYILIDLDTSGATNGVCNLGGDNAAPTAAGLTAKTNLVGKTWTVTTN